MYEKDYIVYLLTNTCNNRTYLGVTNNSTRRLRQHNGEIKGGARYTHAFKGTGCWQYYLQIRNVNKSEALSIERTAKNRRTLGRNAVERRLKVLLPILEKHPQAELVYMEDNDKLSAINTGDKNDLVNDKLITIEEKNTSELN